MKEKGYNVNRYVESLHLNFDIYIYIYIYIYIFVCVGKFRNPRIKNIHYICHVYP